MIAGLVVGILAFIALAYVVAPVFRRRDEVEPEVPVSDELQARKRAALVGILDLEEEREAGKLSEDDYAELTAAYEAEAVDALHALDSLAPADDRLEREIASIRARLKCSHCGAPRVRDEPCPSCGRP